MSGFRLPSGYGSAVTGRAIAIAEVAALPGVLAAVKERGSLLEYARSETDRPPLQGRGPTFVVPVPGAERQDGGEVWVVRHGHRGGWMAPLLGDRYLRFGRPRQLRELDAAVAARSRGIETPRVAAIVLYPSVASYRADVATVHVPDGMDLAASSVGDSAWPADQRLEAWQAAGALTARAAIAGIVHLDLNLRNILVTRSLTAVLLDLDRCRVLPEDSGAAARTRAQRMADRLDRSRRKTEAQHGVSLSRESAAFRAGLAARLGSAGP